MLRYNRIHEENIQVRCVICNNDIGAFWHFTVSNFLNRIQTKDAYHIAPEYEEIEAVILGSWGLYNDKEKWIK
jgi:hypothetical protein